LPKEGDHIAQNHWTASGFANTNLDFLLKQHNIDHVVIVGIRANTCIDTTARYAVELGYHTTLLKDAIAAYSWAVEVTNSLLDLSSFLYVVFAKNCL